MVRWVHEKPVTPGFHPDVFAYGSRGIASVHVVERELILRSTPRIDPRILVLLTLGTGAAMICTQRGLPVFHGNTVRVHGDDWMILGASGFGKSTFTAALIEAGAQLVAEDVSVWEPEGVRPGAGRLKLWPDSRAAFLCSRTWSVVHPDFDKVATELPVVESQRPLSRVIVLGDASAPVGLADLMAQHRVPPLLERAHRSRWMNACAHVLQTCEVRQIRRPESFDACRRLAFDLVG